jgi:GTP-binding protein Era
MTEDLLGDIPPDHRSGFVAVVGRPNVGKSTLMNAILGQKLAIVSPKPQTTRNRILGILTLDDLQAVFMDTPGIHRPRHKLGEFMLAEALSTLPDADLVLWVVDVSRLPNDEDRQVAAVLGRQTLPVILVMNKIDITPPAVLLEHSQRYRELLPTVAEAIAISALQGQGVPAVVDLLRRYLPLGPRYYPPDQITDVQERFLAAELIREKALLHLREEVPYAVAVDLEEFTERPGGVVYIAARLFVERESQKGILIGHEGAMLKRIGSEARQEIEALLEKRVYLDLRVVVKPKWRRDPAELRRLGYYRRRR